MAEQAGYLDTVEQGLALHPEQAATSAAQAVVKAKRLVRVQARSLARAMMCDPLDNFPSGCGS